MSSLTDSLARSQGNEQNKILNFGTLYIVSTPLGNMSDLGPRAKEVLLGCDVWAVEDTRRGKGLATLIGAKPSQLIRCDEYALKASSAKIIQTLKSGTHVAFMSDAGVPCISDPGDRLVASARAEGIPIEGIPGPSAVTLALSISGFSATPFTFWGFLPKKSGQRQEMIQSMLNLEHASVFFESPHRVLKTLEVFEGFNCKRSIFVGRELSKKFEEHVTGTLVEVQEKLKKKPLKGEFTLVLSGIEKKKVKRVHRNKYKDTQDE